MATGKEIINKEIGKPSIFPEGGVFVDRDKGLRSSGRNPDSNSDTAKDSATTNPEGLKGDIYTDAQAEVPSEVVTQSPITPNFLKHLNEGKLTANDKLADFMNRLNESAGTNGDTAHKI
jgi:hypothetical protein